MLEIERKFLVRSLDFKKYCNKSYSIKQGYLNRDPFRTVRVRIKDSSAYITVKGKSNDNGVSRFEWEKEIALNDAEALLNLCEPGVISKKRYLIENRGHVFEVDEFYLENEGLFLAEIELYHPDESFEKPDWLGDEVTGDKRYYNSYLSNNPFSNWD